MKRKNKIKSTVNDLDINTLYFYLALYIQSVYNICILIYNSIYSIYIFNTVYWLTTILYSNVFELLLLLL